MVGPPPLSPDVDYAVVLVPGGEYLPVREQAGSSGNEVAHLASDQRSVRVTGKTSQLGSSRWVEIQLPGGGHGWVPALNLTESHPAGEACSDPRVIDAIQRLLTAGEANDAALLRGAVSPWHGLAIRLDARGGELQFAPDALELLFQTSQPVDWLIRAESGIATSGVFQQDILHPLSDAVGRDSPACSIIPAGRTAVEPLWPDEYANFNFLAFHTAADPTGSEFGWHTWVIGVEYAGGEPYVGVIIRYQGEI